MRRSWGSEEEDGVLDEAEKEEVGEVAGRRTAMEQSCTRISSPRPNVWRASVSEVASAGHITRGCFASMAPVTKVLPSGAQAAVLTASVWSLRVQRHFPVYVVLIRNGVLSGRCAYLCIPYLSRMISAGWCSSIRRMCDLRASY